MKRLILLINICVFTFIFFGHVELANAAVCFCEGNVVDNVCRDVGSKVVGQGAKVEVDVTSGAEIVREYILDFTLTDAASCDTVEELGTVETRDGSVVQNPLYRSCNFLLKYSNCSDYSKGKELTQKFCKCYTKVDESKFRCVQVMASSCDSFPSSPEGGDYSKCEELKDKKSYEQCLVDQYPVTKPVEGGDSSDIGETSDEMSGISEQAKTLNKLGTTDISILIGRLIQTGMGILGAITFAMVVYGGILWMSAAGNAERSKKGTQIVIWAGLGVVVIFASYALIDLVFEAFR